MRKASVRIKSMKSVEYVRQVDYLLIIAVLLLSVMGALAVYSSMNRYIVGEDSVKAAESMSTFIKHVSLMGIGVILMLVLSGFDYADYKILGFAFFVISTLLLIYVKTNGIVLNNAKSWVSLPVIGYFQPSEIAKLTFIMIFAVYLSRLQDDEEYENRWKNVIKLCVYSVIPVGLVIIQPDIGTTMVFVFIVVVILFTYGIKMRYFLIPAALSVPAAFAAWNFLPGHAKNRIMVFLDPISADPAGLGVAFHITRSLTSIASGQMSGKGFLKGYYTQNGLVPVSQSDFVITVIGEEFGFIGLAVMIILFLFILTRCLKIAKNARDVYGRILVIGIAGMYGCHFIENVGMCIGLLPITGIPLPFVSQGSSAMLTNFISMGIVLSVSLRSVPTMFAARKNEV